MEKEINRIGILGGGQLARMLAQKAQQLGFEAWVMSESRTDPAALVTSHWVSGQVSSSQEVLNFLSKVDLATFESEFCDAVILKQAITKSNTEVIPAPGIMSQLQDRLPQKNLLVKYNLPTSDFIKIDAVKDLILAQDTFTKGFVLKKRRFGYDGKGTFIIKNQNQFREFIDQNDRIKNEFIAEEFIPFERELAVMAARNKNGHICFFPLVETFQKNSICQWVKGPSESSKWSALKKKIKIFLNSIDYQGAIAFELFETDSESLLINEIAPRVHNSGHYSMDALTYCQFEAHLRAILNLDLPEPQLLAEGFAMFNLIGQSNNKPKLIYPSKASLHWYQKQINRPGRKLGHINTLAETGDKALKRLTRIQRDFQL